MSTKTRRKKRASTAIGKNKERTDNEATLTRKCEKLAKLLRESRCTVVYTGAGISTAAEIPDYRGPNGLWAMAERGNIKQFENVMKQCDPSKARPTICHMALTELYRRGFVRHILSQNCDGLHLRSGLPQTALSEVHGNMYIEVCDNCVPLRQYIRPYDVTKDTRYRRHNTVRRCDRCRKNLKDTIVHFGENGKLDWPLNWTGAMEAVDSDACDLILVLGSSLKILSKYQCLWPDASERRKTPKQRRKLVIVNLQATTKDCVSDLKIHGYCDDVMRRIMKLLNCDIPDYCNLCDPITNSGQKRQRNNILNKLVRCSCASRKNSATTSPMTNGEHLSTSSEPIDNKHEASISVQNKGVGWWAVGWGMVTGSGKKKRKKPLSRLIESKDPNYEPETKQRRLDRPIMKKTFDRSSKKSNCDIEHGQSKIKRLRGRPKKVPLLAEIKKEESSTPTTLCGPSSPRIENITTLPEFDHNKDVIASVSCKTEPPKGITPPRIYLPMMISSTVTHPNMSNHRLISLSPPSTSNDNVRKVFIRRALAPSMLLMSNDFNADSTKCPIYRPRSMLPNLMHEQPNHVHIVKKKARLFRVDDYTAIRNLVKDVVDIVCAKVAINFI